MDPSLIAGVIAGVGVVVYGIGFGNLGLFLSLQSAAIVIGGTFAALVASTSSNAIRKVPAQVVIAIKGHLPNPEIFIDQIEACATVARKNGLLALEDYARSQEDKFMGNSLLLIIDAVSSDKARMMLEDELAFIEDRHASAINFFEKGSAFAPAFGLVGTVIGLVVMLSNLSFDSEHATDALTSGMAIALITTFYGCLLSNLFFAPIASKLQARHDREMLCKQIVLEGILSIQAGENPKFIREKLISFLPYQERAELMKNNASVKSIETAR